MDMTKGIMDFVEKMSAGHQQEMSEALSEEREDQKLSPSPFSSLMDDPVLSPTVDEKTNVEAITETTESVPPVAISPTFSTNTLTTTTTTTATSATSASLSSNVTTSTSSPSVSMVTASLARSFSAERITNSLSLGRDTDGDISPPPRPLTSSEVLGLTEPDPEMQIDLPAKKSRSLPVSPNPLPHLAHMFQSSFSTRPELDINKRPSLIDDSIDLRAKLRPTPLTSKLNRSSATAAPTNSGPNQQFCLRWNNYQTNLTNVFDELLQNESFVDVTLACDGQSIKAHKMVLSACSPYFQALFYDNPCQHPIIIMRDVRWQELKALMEFMYKGEINVSQDQINPLLKVAEMLKIRGLAEVGNGGQGMAAHPMVPEQRMTVYDDDEVDDLSEEPNDDEDVARALAAVANEDDVEQSLRCQRSKRVRLMDPMLRPPYKLPLDLNMGNPMQRKRSRDGNLIDMEMREDHRSPVTPNRPRNDSAESRKSPHSNASAVAPLSMTASTIVRNPFASPNSSALSNASNSERASSGLAGSTTGGNPSSIVAPGACLTGPSGASSNYRCNSPIQSAGGSALSSPVGPTANSGRDSAHHLPTHGAHHPPLHGHHHHAAAAAQQLAAQHQFQAAAHSHAMASALAAAAVGSAGTAVNPSGPAHHDDLEIKPEIAEMIREEERAKMIEGGGHPWMGGASTSSVADSYQYQLQSMWQKCWNTNQQNLMQQLRFRERGPLKSWRPEAMAEAIFSVLKEGLSLSQAARKYDIPYPTFVLYANRVHNMLGPSLDGGTDPRPKARGRPQRILLGMWPEELIRSVIKAVVFRDYREIKEEMAHPFVNGQPHPPSPFGPAGNTGGSANGYHNAAKITTQNVPLPPPDSTSPLSSMPESLRRQILSQQQQSPLSQSMNMYKSPAYLQRSEIEDQLGVMKQGDRRGSENMPDLTALGLMGIPGLHVLPPQSHRVANPLQQNMANYSRERERERERERDREMERERERDREKERDRERDRETHRGRERERERERDREREREYKEAIQARQFGSQSRDSALAAVTAAQKPSSGTGPTGPISPFPHFKPGKDHPNYAYNKRLLENLPPGIDFEAIANGILQKSVNKSPRFEDFFPSQDMSELFAANNENANNPGYHPPPPVRESPLMKIKLEQQHATELPHED